MMMKLLLLTTMMATLFGVVVAEALPIRGNYLRQNHGDRILKKVDWEKIAEEIQANQEEEEDEEIDWNAFAAGLVSAGVITTTQPTVSSTTAKPSTSPTQTPTPEPTKVPTLTPTKQPSDNPTPAPTLVPTSSDPVSPVVATIAPTIAVSSVTGGGGGIYIGTPSAKPTEFNFLFSFGNSVFTEVTLPSFRLEFVATTNMNRKLRQDELMTEDAENAFVEIISNAILSYLQGNLSRELVSVDLNVEDKRENHFPQMVMFSYDLGGSVTFVGGEDELPPLPTSNELLTEVLGLLETDPFVEVLKSFDNSGLFSIDDVVVSTSNASGTASQIQIEDSAGIISNSSEEGSDGVATPAVIAFVTAFAFTMAVIGFITVRKLREYQENEDDDSFGRVKTTYHNMKEKFNYVSPMGKNRRYDQFESPAASEDSLFGDIEESDSEYPIATNVDIEQPSSKALQSAHLSDEAFLDKSERTSESGHQDLSLDLLYSDSDSYFGSSVGTSIVTAGVRPRMLSKDFVYSDTDSSLRSDLDGKEVTKSNPHNANIQSIEKVNQLLLYNDDAAPSDSEITEAESTAQEVAADYAKEWNPFSSESSVTDDLFARLNELENKIVFTESQFSQDDTTATERFGDYRNAYSEAEDSSAVQKRDISAGIFTNESLGMIQRDRLRGTPPPSETERDGDCSKSASLLGNALYESDGDDDELLFEGSVSTIASEIDSHC
mmetsp:Transcript_5923/g.9948  ORF Transcript_5923/g.9948 Transcript_5923/m.9948 type:complete len:718 (+) Transcript_5923:167-2320(+)